VSFINPPAPLRVPFANVAPSNQPVGIASSVGFYSLQYNLGLMVCVSIQEWYRPSALWATALVNGIVLSKMVEFLSNQTI
jgi:hypothetical protein